MRASNKILCSRPAGHTYGEFPAIYAGARLDDVRVVAFDVYATLIDVFGVTEALSRIDAVGDRAHAFSALWRQKQLEYTWRKSVMGKYQGGKNCCSNFLAIFHSRFFRFSNLHEPGP